MGTRVDTGRDKTAGRRRPASGRAGGPATERVAGTPQRSARRRGWPLWLNLSVWSTAGLLLVAACVLAGLHLRLSQGPIPIDSMISGLKAALDRDLAPLKVSFGRTTLRYADRGFGFSVRLTDIRITDDAGATVAEAPSAAVGLSTEALMALTLAPASIDLLQPKLLLTVTEDNSLTLRSARSGPVGTSADGVTAPALTADAASRPLQLDAVLNDVLGGAAQGGSGGRVSYLRALGLRDALLVLDVHGQRSIWGVPTLEARRSRGDDGSARVRTQGTVVSASATPSATSCQPRSAMRCRRWPASNCSQRRYRPKASSS
jgi:hypothetical protein